MQAPRKLNVVTDFAKMQANRQEPKPVWTRPAEMKNAKRRAAVTAEFTKRFPGKGHDRLDRIGM